MAVKDHTQHFEGLQALPTIPELQVPNTVSRSAGTGERAFTGIIAESGKPVLDVELNLHQDAAWMESYLLRRWHSPSGWLRGRTHLDAYCDWITEVSPGIIDDSSLIDGSGEVGSAGSSGSSGSSGSGVTKGPFIHEDDTLLDALILPRIEATVAGHPVVVEYTNTRSSGYNLIGLSPAKIYDGTNATVKRTDFIFLEVWRALVAPSPRATGQIQVVVIGDLTVGDMVVINGLPLTAVAGLPGVDDFVIGVSEDATATNISDAINLVTNSFSTIVTGRSIAGSGLVELTAVVPGAGGYILQTGNFITTSVVVATVGAMVAAGATLTGGVDRPNKPNSEQNKIFRHGNVLSPSPVWLDDEMVDPVINRETSQRIQLQYRIRTTSDAEALNYKKHPDGFSSLIAGGGVGDAAIFAQGNRSAPVWAGNGRDTVSYPFVPADKTSTWLDTSALAFGWEDDGLYVAGDGSSEAASNLGAIDGYVFAIPIAFVHRHNNASDSLAGVKGFNPESNTNGAPVYDHAGYTGYVGTIPAGLSDRPDGHFCNVITQENLLDLRRHVVLPGVDLAAELKYQMQGLMDGNLRTWSVDTADEQDLGGDSGDVSTRYLICDEIGRTKAQGGTAPLAGEDTQRGNLIRSYDHIARRFADQPIVERVVIAFWPGDRNGTPVAPGTDNPGKYITKSGGATQTDKWYEGDVLNFDLEHLNVTTLGGIFDSRDGAGTGGGLTTGLEFIEVSPDAIITDVLNVWHDDGHYDQVTDQNVQLGIIKGLGTTHLEIWLDANDTPITEGQVIGGGNIEHKVVGSDITGVPPIGDADMGSVRRIFVEIEITYPLGRGASHTMDHEVVPDTTIYSDAVGVTTGPGPLIENDTAQRPADFEQLLATRYRAGYREIQTEYIANDTIAHGTPLPGTAIGTATPEQLVSIDRDTLRFPRRIWSDDVGVGLYVQDAVVTADKTVDVDNSEFGSSSRIIALDTVMGTQLSGVGHTLCNVRYFAQDPIPNYGVNGGGYQVAYYYRSNSPQTAGVKDGDITSTGDGTLPTTLQVEPLLASKGVWTGQVGMGGHSKGFPYAAPLDQIPINDGTTVPVPPDMVSGTTEEWFFAATAQVEVADFDAGTGLLNLHAFVEQDIQDIVSFGGPGNDQKPRKDAEFRAYYPFADNTTYRPTVFAQPLFGAVRHKSFTPFLARAVANVPGVAGGLLFRKSELLLVVLSRFAELDDNNNVFFSDTGNRTLAAVYRTRNLLLTVGDRICL